MTITVTLGGFPILSYKNCKTVNDELNGNIYFEGTLSEWAILYHDDYPDSDKAILYGLTFNFGIGQIVNSDGTEIDYLKQENQQTNPLHVLCGLLLQFVVMSLDNDMRVTNDFLDGVCNFNSVKINEYINIDIDRENNTITITPTDSFIEVLPSVFKTKFNGGPGSTDKERTDAWKEALRIFCSIAKFECIVSEASGGAGIKNGRGGSRHRRHSRRRITKRKSRKMRRTRRKHRRRSSGRR
jgi:hypothetical protein